MPKEPYKMYVAYAGDRYLMEGNSNTLSKELNIKKETVWRYASATHKNKVQDSRTAIVIDKVEEE